MSSPAAWHPDPTGKHDHRWWDGTHWTEHVADAGEAKVDHLPPGDGPPPPGGGDHPPATPRADADRGADGGLAGGTADAGGAAAGPAAGTGATWQQPGEAGTGGLASDQPAWQQDDGGTSQPGYGQGQPGYGDPAGSQGNYGQSGQGGQYGQQGLGGHDQYGQQPAAWDQGGQQYQQGQSTDGVAIAALVVGIVSLLTSWFLLGGLGGIIALVLGIVAMGRVKRNRAKGRGMALTGVITGVLAIAVAVLVVVLFGSLFGDAAAEYERCLEENERQVCDQQLERTFMDRFTG